MTDYVDEVARRGARTRLEDGLHERDDDAGPGAWYHAALAYRRECGWDFAPLGGWRVGLVRDRRLVGFAIAYALDERTSLADAAVALRHLWVARDLRRRGVARGLVEEAERRRGPLRYADVPWTDDGEALVRAIPWLLERHERFVESLESGEGKGP